MPTGRRDPNKYDWEKARGLIEAFGERKSLTAWADDPRCPVSRETLRTRLAMGWPPERAITASKHDQPLPKFTYQGRTFTLRGWAKHTGIPYDRLYARLYISKMTFEQAITKNTEDGDYSVLVTAFSETKPVYLWAVDPRAKATSATILKRVRAGWNPQLAITEEPEHRPNLGKGRRHEAFGKHLSIPEWARLSHIGEQTIRNYMARYHTSLEDVLRASGWLPDWVDSDHAEIEVDPTDLQPGDLVLAVTLGPRGTRVAVRRHRGAGPADGPDS